MTASSKSLQNINDLIRDTIFIVNVPEVAIYPDKATVRCDRVNGKWVKRDLTRSITVGWNLIKIARAAMDGMRITIQNRRDIKRMNDLLGSFIEDMGMVSVLPNTADKNTEDLEIVKQFAETLFKHQGSYIESKTINLKSLISNLGFGHLETDSDTDREINRGKTYHKTEEIKVERPSIF